MADTEGIAGKEKLSLLCLLPKPVSLAASLLKILEMNSKYRLMVNEDEKVQNAPGVTR